jgi:hypothetical protein
MKSDPVHLLTFFATQRGQAHIGMSYAPFSPDKQARTQSAAGSVYDAHDTLAGDRSMRALTRIG